MTSTDATQKTIQTVNTQHTTEIGDLTLKVGKNLESITKDEGDIKAIQDKLAK